MSFNTNIRQILPEIIHTENNQNLRSKLFNNYQLNITNKKFKSVSSATPSINSDVNYLKDKIIFTPKNRNKIFNSEKTEYSSDINDIYFSKIFTNSEIKPIFSHIKINTLSPNKKIEIPKSLLNSKNNININDDNQNNKKIQKNHYNSYKTSSFWYRKTEDLNRINKYDTRNINKFSNLFLSYKADNMNKIKNKNNYNKINKVSNRFNSLECYIENCIKIDENKLLNRNTPKLENYLDKSECDKLSKKAKNLLNTQDKIKNIAKDTKLILALCEYINSKFSKLYNEKRRRLNDIKQEKKQMKLKQKYDKPMKLKLRKNFIHLTDVCKVNNKIKSPSKNKIQILYKNGYFSKSFFFPTSLSYKILRKDLNKKEVNSLINY